MYCTRLDVVTLYLRKMSIPVGTCDAWRHVLQQTRSLEQAVDIITLHHSKSSNFYMYFAILCHLYLQLQYSIAVLWVKPSYCLYSNVAATFDNSEFEGVPKLERYERASVTGVEGKRGLNNSFILS